DVRSARRPARPRPGHGPRAGGHRADRAAPRRLARCANGSGRAGRSRPGDAAAHRAGRGGPARDDGRRRLRPRPVPVSPLERTAGRRGRPRPVRPVVLAAHGRLQGTAHVSVVVASLSRSPRSHPPHAAPPLPPPPPPPPAPAPPPPP